MELRAGEHTLWTPEAISRFSRYIGGLSYAELRCAYQQLEPFASRSVYFDQAAITHYVIGCYLRALA